MGYISPQSTYLSYVLYEKENKNDIVLELGSVLFFKRETEIQTHSDKEGGGADKHSANSYTNILKVSLREVGFYATSIRLQMIHGQKAQSDNQTNATLCCLSNSVKLDPRFPGLCIPQWRWEGGK